MILKMMVTRAQMTMTVKTHQVQTLAILIMIPQMIQTKIQMTIQMDPSQVTTNPQVTRTMKKPMIRMYRLRFTNNGHQTLEKVLNKMKMKKKTLRQN